MIQLRILKVAAVPFAMIAAGTRHRHICDRVARRCGVLIRTITSGDLEREWDFKA